MEMFYAGAFFMIAMQHFMPLYQRRFTATEFTKDDKIALVKAVVFMLISILFVTTHHMGY